MLEMKLDNDGVIIYFTCADDVVMNLIGGDVPSLIMKESKMDVLLRPGWSLDIKHVEIRNE